jgi:hypothetical protein
VLTFRDLGVFEELVPRPATARLPHIGDPARGLNGRLGPKGPAGLHLWAASFLAEVKA